MKFETLLLVMCLQMIRIEVMNSFKTVLMDKTNQYQPTLNTNKLLNM